MEVTQTQASPQRAEAPWGTITVPANPGREATIAVDVAMALARQAAMAVELVAVPPPGVPVVTTELFLASQVRQRIRSGQLPPRSWQVLEAGDVADALVEHVTAGPTRMLCMASQARGALGEMVLGSVSEAVLRRSPVPVLLVGPNVYHVPEHYGRLVVALDGSPQADGALQVAAELDRHLDVGLFLVEVLGTDGLPPEADVHESALLQRSANGLTPRPVGFDVLHSTNVADAIVDYADQWNDRIVVLGTHGRTGLSRLAMGSVALAVVRHSHCPVLVVPPTATLAPRSVA